MEGSIDGVVAVGDCLLRRRTWDPEVCGGGVEGRLGGRAMSAVRLSRKSYCF